MKLKKSQIMTRKGAKISTASCAKLMFALQRADYFDIDAFLDLEQILLASINSNSPDLHPSHLILALQAHSSWSYKLHHDQKYKKNAKNHRYYKTFDKYNAEFTDKLLGHLLQ